MDNNIYSALYDITQENIREAGGEFSVSKEAFAELSTIHPQAANIFHISRTNSNKLFLEKAYIHLLKRFADESAYRNWEGRFSLFPCQFQRLLTMTLITSDEFSNKNVKVYDNFYSIHNQYGGDPSNSKKAVEVKKSEIKLHINNRLRKIYNRLPEAVKKVLRKILKRR
ncbi:MAG: hypothetical protein J5999_00560 [Oscillospiraceae bacterium]|nr:hypothetical protein [Oscillospiraceae bacterium]